MDSGFKVRENFLRRQAARLGLRLEKSRGKKWSINNQGGYRIIDTQRNTIVYGSRYELTIEDVTSYLNEYEKKIRNKSKKTHRIDL